MLGFSNVNVTFKKTKVFSGRLHSSKKTHNNSKRIKHVNSHFPTDAVPLQENQTWRVTGVESPVKLGADG